MPSGAKKRKAAKKKKEQQANNNSSSSANDSNTKTLGNDAPKSQDERDGDGCYVGSPSSQDHHGHQHPFKEGSQESEKRDPSSVQSFDSENKSMEKISREVEGGTQKLGVEDDGATKIERELKSEEDSGSQNISIKHVEFGKDSHDGSSSNSSDNESQVEAKTSKKAVYTSHNGEKDSFPKNVIQGIEKASFGEADNSVVETAPVGHSVKSEEVIRVTHGDLLENSYVSDIIESRLKENEESKRNEEIVFPLSENVGASSTVVENVANENEGKILLTSVTPAESINGAESTRDSKIPDSSENQPLIASTSRVEQRISWMNCCGLLDVLTGSGR